MPRREGWVNWLTTEAREILLQDLEDGTLPLEDEVMSAIEAWGYYSQLFEFREIVYTQFEHQLIKHREQVGLKNAHIEKQLAAIAHDRRLHPEKAYNRRGERVFYLSPAYPLLVEDVQEERYKSLSKIALFHSRDEYKQEWKFEIFERRLRQEIMRQKFVNECNIKRAKKEEAKAKAREARRKKEEHDYQKAYIKAMQDLEQRNSQGNN